MTPSTNPPPPPTRYFAFGSNLWQHQMSLRCPSSPFTGLARLPGYKWFINARGFANIAPATTSKEAEKKEEEEVWGLVYDLSPTDEAQLDRNEGVPYAYEKRLVPVEFWPTTTTTDGEKEVQKVEMLIYIDFKRHTGGHQPRREYIHRMNMGIRDALREGVPRGYVERVLRGYIPAADDEEGEIGAEEKGVALRQAAAFEMDGRGMGMGGSVSGTPAAVGSGVVSTAEEEEEEVPERASEIIIAAKFGRL
ncbi:hypothetical protein C8A01DRAFT_47155 [Parachaetomium inaequale]|uniref:gamma-glutamylcyclotransferase n=1 Tax=Parachaetomium inaequale TaxID=2588326 RepID=A0AAN6PEB8_9PEZI|nr:hypothetical protein C8A01DRAFT_47155 [Parachaetomium inaequale]